MAGETVKTEAICLAIRPWSRTSHVVRWLTPSGPLTTLVKGAERPKSAFLGQYDLNYTCEIVYYASARGDAHALRECAPLLLRERLRGDYRAIVTSGYYRSLVAAFAPTGPDGRDWYALLARALDALPASGVESAFDALLRFELGALALTGLKPDFSGYPEGARWAAFSIENGVFCADGPHPVRVSGEVAAYLNRPGAAKKNLQILLDAARVIGVFYSFHLDCAPDVRRSVLRMICNKKENNENG